METKYEELLQAVLEALEDEPGEDCASGYFRKPPKTVGDVRNRLESCLDDIEPEWRDWQGMEVK